METVTSYEFGDLIVRPADFQILREGVPLSIEPKSFKVLVYLIENRGRTVSKDDLIQAVWNGTFVTDNALTRVIAQLRRELEDDAKQPRYIETVPTVGYRFIAELKPAPSPVPRLRWKSRPAVAIAATAVGIAVLLILVFANAVPRGDVPPVPAARLRFMRQFTVSPE